GGRKRRAIALVLGDGDDLAVAQLFSALVGGLGHLVGGLGRGELGGELAIIEAGERRAGADDVAFLHQHLEQGAGQLAVHAHRADGLDHARYRRGPRNRATLDLPHGYGHHAGATATRAAAGAATHAAALG